MKEATHSNPTGGKKEGEESASAGRPRDVREQRTLEVLLGTDKEDEVASARVRGLSR